MGTTLSTPATEKTSECGEDERFIYGISEMQGWRITMEDAHTAVLELQPERSDRNAFFAVYDGHGGGTVAKFSGNNLHRRLVSEESYIEEHWDDALKKAFLGTDEDIRADPGFFNDPSGCTAVAALFTRDKKVYVANAGDSRSVISVKGEVKPLSFDHKPQNDAEIERIRAAGGYIEYGRVNGNLALSRAIGDFEFKKNYALTPEKQVITADPDIIVHDLTDEDEFLVLACDGIWDCLTSQQVVDIIRLQVSQRRELTEIAEFLCDHCLAPDTTSGAGVGCDNMTVLIIAILNGRTKEEWYNWIADRVERHYGYDTPSTVPSIYPPSRLNAFRARKQAFDELKDKQNNNGESDNGNNGFSSWRNTAAFGLARSVLGAGISFHPATGIVTDNGEPSMFKNDDSDDEDSGEDVEMADGSSLFAPFGLQRPFTDVTRSLKAQLDELEESSQEEGSSRFAEIDEDSVMSEPDEDLQNGIGSDSVRLSHPQTTEHFETVHDFPEGSAHSAPDRSKGEIPPLLGSKSYANVDSDVDHVEQLKSFPEGDKISEAVKVEGLLDTSEDPTRETL